MSKVGTRTPGAHMVMKREGLKLRTRTDRKGEPYPTLSAARKAAKAGDAIVRMHDGEVVSVK